MVKTKGKHNKYSVIIIIILIIVFLIFLKKASVKKEKKIPPRKPEIEEVRPEAKAKPAYRIAIIIDDVGYPSGKIEEYKNFKGKLSFSVLPFLTGSVRYADILYEHGFEIMIHIPMEPLTYPGTDPGPCTLHITDPQQEIEKKIRMIIQNNPYAIGANNHMGSKATQDRQIMDWTMDILKQNDLFFIDSLTTRNSCAYELALRNNLNTAKRDIFLDNEDSFPYINAQFEKLKKIAKSRGTAIGIGHFTRDNTIKVLNYQLPRLKKENYTLIFASEAVIN